MTPGTTRHQSRDILGHELDDGRHFKERVTKPNRQRGGRGEPVHTSGAGRGTCRTKTVGLRPAGWQRPTFREEGFAGSAGLGTAEPITCTGESGAAHRERRAQM